MDSTINNLGWANTMIQMSNYIYGINPWTAVYQWSITGDRNTNAPAVTTNMGRTIFFTDAGSVFMMSAQLQGYDTTLPFNAFATTFPVLSTFNQNNNYYNTSSWTSYYTAGSKWYAVNTVNGANKVADKTALESFFYAPGLVAYGPWVCTVPRYRVICWDSQSGTIISSATFLTFPSQ